MKRPRGLAWWVGGAAVAFTGVALVRFVPHGTGRAAVPVSLAGFTLAIVGIFLMTLATRQRS